MIKLKTAFFLFLLLSLVSFAPSSIFNNSNMEDTVANKDAGNALKTKLANNKGQIVLINFWASYDAVSRIENIRFTSLMNESHSSKSENATSFVVISVSLDSYQSVFQETVKRDGLSATQNIHATNGFNSELANHYKLGNKFGNLLLDAQGEVIARNFSASELKDLLQNE